MAGLILGASESLLLLHRFASPNIDLNTLAIMSMVKPLRRSSRILSATTPQRAAATAVGESGTAAAAVATSMARTRQSRDAHTGVKRSKRVASDEITTRQPRKRARNASEYSSELTDLPDEPDKHAPLKVKKARKKAGAVEYTVDDFPKRSQSLWRIGPHVSAAGGVENSVLNAASIGYVIPHTNRNGLKTRAAQSDSICSISKVSEKVGFSSHI